MPKNDKNSGPFNPGLLLLNRLPGQSLSMQIHDGIQQAIFNGNLPAGSRLPSCRDLAAQLGVARGTVRRAYDGLVDNQLLIARGAAGTFVCRHVQPPSLPNADHSSPRSAVINDYDMPALTFQMGVPASDCFPAKVWTRLLHKESRQLASLPFGYPDPRGSLALRHELAAYLAMTRGIRCHPSQILLTQGYAGALGLIFMVLALRGKTGWIEDPGYPLATRALQLAGINTIPVKVDDAGICVEEGIKHGRQADFALVTPGQQAPLGVTLTSQRRQMLLNWANERQAWIIEDDYLGELQLYGRAAPALASQDSEGRVLHIGTFSKTLSPLFRCGYLVVPPALASRFADAMAAFNPSASPLLHNTIAAFMRDGHFLRHLRRMKRTYRERLELMAQSLKHEFPLLRQAGLSLIVGLADASDDQAIAREALKNGMAPSPLSSWYAAAQHSRRGLLLGVTTLPAQGFDACSQRLRELADNFS
ncbi:GntR family transcriptional regulator [Izhakiella australiensis]|uniref:GntR family transcriptional regulator n=1 Tax=Izhakiella australiensis TaxID=1926881 RepID=A0A1S8YJE0_9GAMM|nr:PLP-dependent aminotransferase family protein [Izhakiella australiensis]OON39199.1 GntR family transcriptional regulator [Izhakiella australiensis]